MDVPILWQFTSSHFNEKARWALDFKRIPHIRNSLIPGFHIAVIKPLTGQTQVPVVKLNGTVICGSGAIIDALERAYPEPSLYPADEAERRRALELQTYFDEELGPYIRRWVFFMARDNPEFVREAFASHASAPTRLANRMMSPLIRPLMRRLMDITPESSEAAHRKMLEAMDRLEHELRPSGYLVGDRFTVADLTAAALLSPLARPPQFPYRPDLALPEPIAAVRNQLESRPAMQWTLQIYRQHRGASAEVSPAADVARHATRRNPVESD